MISFIINSSIPGVRALLVYAGIICIVLFAAERGIAQSLAPAPAPSAVPPPATMPGAVMLSEALLSEAAKHLYNKDYAKALNIINAALSSSDTLPRTALTNSSQPAHESEQEKARDYVALLARARALRSAALRGVGDTASALAGYDSVLLAIEAARQEDRQFHWQNTQSAGAKSSVDDKLFLQSITLAATQARFSTLAKRVSERAPSNANAASSEELALPSLPQRIVEETARFLEKHDAGNPSMLYRRGYALFQMQEYDSAARDFKQAALGLQPYQAATAYYHLGLCFYFTRQLEKARQSFSQTLALAPFHAESYFYRGCINTTQDRYLEAMKDFTDALRYNPSDGASMGMLGTLLINAGKIQEGCTRLMRAAQLQYAPAIDMIDRYCNRAEDGSKIVRLPTITVEADRNVNYAQRIQNTKQTINVGRRINPMLPTLRNMAGQFSLANASQLSDGTSIIAPSNLLANSGMLPLQSMINPVDCNGSVVNTKSFVSLQCVAFVLRQETEPLGNKEIDKIVKQLQQLADELTIIKASMGNLGAVSRAPQSQASSDNIFGGDLARMDTIYRDFQALLQQLQKKVVEYEKVLQAEGKLPPTQQQYK